MDTIKDVIGTFFKELQQKQQIRQKDNPEFLLKKVLTKKEIQHIKFNYFRAGTLGIYVDSSSWLYYLSLKKNTLLHKLKKCSNEIKDIRFSLGEW